jgi:hypothetical protein
MSPARTHQPEQRLGRLVGAAADTIAIFQPELTTASRRAVAITDTPSELLSLSTARLHCNARVNVSRFHIGAQGEEPRYRDAV